MKKPWYFFLIVWIGGLLFFNTQQLFAQKQLAVWPGIEWKTATPEAQRINAARLDKMYADDAFTGNLLLVRSGYLVSEKYDQEKGKKYAPHIFSCTKGIISALIGIALYQQHLTSIQQNVLDFFPEYKRPNQDEQKRQITLYHLLTMTSGLYWTDALSSRIVYDKPDWSFYILDQPMAAAPGTQYNYNSGNAHLLSSILHKATGLNTLAFAEKYLFEPLMISKVEWEKNSKGVYLGGWGIKMTLEDMAKFGYLYLKNGKWKKQQVIPAKWINDSTQFQVDEMWDSVHWGYGYLWSIPPNMPYTTPTLIGGDGHNTCVIALIPDLDIVLVYAGSSHHNEILRLIKQYLVPAIEQFDN